MSHESATAGDGTTAVMLAVVDGNVVVRVPQELEDAPEACTSAELGWDEEEFTVTVDGVPTRGGLAEIGPHVQSVHVEPQHGEPSLEYLVEVEADAMRATLLVRRTHGVERTLHDAAETSALRLHAHATPVEAPAASVQQAQEKLAEAGVAWGIDDAAVQAAIRNPGGLEVVATGRPAIPGEDARIEPLVDFHALRYVGVERGTALLRRTPRREGTPGTTVTGATIQPPAVSDVALSAGSGAGIDEDGLLALATSDGQPLWDGAGRVEVRQELELQEVGTDTGDINFCADVRVLGDVHEGRRVVARGRLWVGGNVDRAYLESGREMTVTGSTMSSVLRAGGPRAVAAGVIDLIADMPSQLAETAMRAGELREAAATRGAVLAFGHSVRVVLERYHKPLLGDLLTASHILHDAGVQHLSEATQLESFHRLLSTAANASLSADQFRELLEGLSRLVDDFRHAMDETADMVVHYMQASEVEATGEVTIHGSGIFNSRVVAWGGVLADHPKAVVRGGTIMSHGPVRVHELGCPGGAAMKVQLGRGADLVSDLVYSGTILTSPGNTHRFIGDRSHVKVTFAASGAMDVESLTA